jgi:hypothetical protein
MIKKILTQQIMKRAFTLIFYEKKKYNYKKIFEKKVKKKKHELHNKY